MLCLQHYRIFIVAEIRRKVIEGSFILVEEGSLSMRRSL